MPDPIIHVEINDFQGGAKALQALIGGSTDFVCGAYEQTLHMAAKGISIKAIALQFNSLAVGGKLASQKLWKR